jgi:hypothetical protein
MRSLAIVSLLLAGLAGLSVLPAVAAIPPVCIERDVQQGPIGAGYSTCYDEYVEVVNCPTGAPQGVHYYNDLGPAYVRVDYCLPHMPPPSASAASAAPDCSKVPDVGTSQNGVVTSDDCKVLVSVDVLHCPFGERWVTNQHGPLTVRHTVCREPYPPGGDMAAAAPACPQRTEEPVFGLMVHTFSDCTARIDYKGYDCVWNCGWTTVLQGPPVTIRVWQQQDGSASTMAADPFPTCIRECFPLPDGCDLRDATPTAVGPAAPWFNPRQAVWGNDCTADVEPVGACAPPSGSTIDREVGFVRVVLLVCDGGAGDRLGGLLGPAPA